MPEFIIWSELEKICGIRLKPSPVNNTYTLDQIRKHFPYEIYLGNFWPMSAFAGRVSGGQSIFNWAAENLKNDFTSAWDYIFFKNKEDQILFGLTWL